MKKNLFFYSNLLAWALVVLIVANYVFGWNPPSQSPPGGNVTLSSGALPAGSPGYVQFASSSTAFGADSNLFWDNTNKRLGIGTTNPQTKLDVAGAVKIGSQDTCNANTAGAMRYNSTLSQFEGCNGISWKLVAAISCDSQPASFSFTNVTNASLNTLYTSNTVTLSDFDCPTISASVSGQGNPQINCNNSGTWGTSCTVSSSNPTIQVRLTSPASTNTTYTANVTVGGVTGTYSVTTRAWASCGDPVTFTYKGSTVTYGTVSHNGECWMDRNLGATQVATAYNDANAYGDLFQWGRLADGHQNRTSGTTTTLSSTDVPGHDKFILTSSSPYDWRSPQNNNLWQGVSGTNNPCPSGWRIPTEAEWTLERASWSPQDYNGAFASPLKLTVAGYRSSNGSLGNVGSNGYYWSSTVSGTYARRLAFNSSNASMNYYDRADGFSVRCIKD